MFQQMQSEAASYFIQQPYFGNGYEPSWDSYPVNNSYLSNGSNLFDGKSIKGEKKTMKLCLTDIVHDINKRRENVGRV